jgi:hypothetical protein
MCAFSNGSISSCYFLTPTYVHTYLQGQGQQLIQPPPPTMLLPTLSIQEVLPIGALPAVPSRPFPRSPPLLPPTHHPSRTTSPSLTRYGPITCLTRMRCPTLLIPHRMRRTCTHCAILTSRRTRIQVCNPFIFGNKKKKLDQPYAFVPFNLTDIDN